MRWITRRRLVMTLTLALCLAVAVAGWRAAPMIRIGVAYKAKSACSGVFVSHRDLAGVLADIEVDDLWPLRYINVSVDEPTRTVTATALRLVTRRAAYRDGLGCTLLFEALAPPSSVVSSAPRAEIPDEVNAAESASSASELAAVVRRAFDEPDLEHPRRTRAVVVLHDGRVVAERYGGGVDAATPVLGWSMAKSVVNALVGILVRDGRLNLDTPAALPEWSGSNDPRRSISLGDLLRMSSGLAFDQDISNAGADTIRMLLGVGDASAFALAQPLIAKPGTEWRYSNGTSNIVARIIRNAFADEAAYLAFPRAALFNRIGMPSATLETDAAGTFIGSSYAYATARDWARFGMLYLQDGMWESQRILPAGWVAYTTSPAPADRTKGYGAHFWLKIPEEYCADPRRLPADAFHAVGHEGQFVTIVPSHRLVIVRLGVTRYPGAWDQCRFADEVIHFFRSSAGSRSIA